MEIPPELSPPEALLSPPVPHAVTDTSIAPASNAAAICLFSYYLSFLLDALLRLFENVFEKSFEKSGISAYFFFQNRSLLTIFSHCP